MIFPEKYDLPLNIGLWPTQVFETFKRPLCNKRLLYTVLKWHVLDIFHHLVLIKEIWHLGQEISSFYLAHHGRFHISGWWWSRVNFQNITVSLMRTGTKENFKYMCQLKIFLAFMGPIDISHPISLRSNQTLLEDLLALNRTVFSPTVKRTIV
jgi:hypothetical protein